MKVCMISTNHYLLDTRIYYKEALSLKNHGLDVTIISRGDFDETGVTKDGIKYILIKPGIKKCRNILQDKLFIYEQYTNKSYSEDDYNRVFEIAAQTKSDVYHLHDLYLVFLGRKLKQLPHRPKVIYDVHESYPDVIRDYNKCKGINNILKFLYSYYVYLCELKNSRNFDYVVNVEDTINDRFTKHLGYQKVGLIYNYPIIHQIKNQDFTNKKYDLIYCGVITELRGAMKMLEVLNECKKYKNDIKMILVGHIQNKALEMKMKKYIHQNSLSENIVFTGLVSYDETSVYYRQSKIGMLLLYPVNKFKRGINVKLFEYMMYGLPIITTNLPHLTKIVKESNCGFIIRDIDNTNEIQKFIISILENQELYLKFSKNGYKAISNTYKWDSMERKLLSVYSSL